MCEGRDSLLEGKKGHREAEVKEYGREDTETTKVNEENREQAK